MVGNFTSNLGCPPSPKDVRSLELKAFQLQIHVAVLEDYFVEVIADASCSISLVRNRSLSAHRNRLHVVH
jgi:hypothetical protein